MSGHLLHKLRMLTLYHIILTLNDLQEDLETLHQMIKILALSKLKAFADDKFTVA